MKWRRVDVRAGMRAERQLGDVRIIAVRDARMGPHPRLRVARVCDHALRDGQRDVVQPCHVVSLRTETSVCGPRASGRPRAAHAARAAPPQPASRGGWGGSVLQPTGRRASRAPPTAPPGTRPCRCNPRAGINLAWRSRCDGAAGVRGGRYHAWRGGTGGGEPANEGGTTWVMRPSRTTAPSATCGRCCWCRGTAPWTGAACRGWTPAACSPRSWTTVAAAGSAWRFQRRAATSRDAALRTRHERAGDRWDGGGGLLDRHRLHAARRARCRRTESHLQRPCSACSAARAAPATWMLEWSPRFDYARADTPLKRGPTAAVATGGGERLVLEGCPCRGAWRRTTTASPCSARFTLMTATSCRCCAATTRKAPPVAWTNGSAAAAARSARGASGSTAVMTASRATSRRSGSRW
jgi:hypothetical protein